jgi:hypothetical protein
MMKESRFLTIFEEADKKKSQALQYATRLASQLPYVLTTPYWKSVFDSSVPKP